ncbi:hypothetical protein [Candidatus Uabimicrobium amorphum]|uniref:Uncharacterized protein n=1 Tax=Uabimicrobium amorphum TaxID=2596890 RepID=A0A5S9F4V2_UABAM|nr:hypothetical protein [Candidatus Uabimicrobium amorphum]BBM84874.1 hypothetical protein UABAM_03235 [Candidatus Uabimicrobium amorphum]
MFPTKLRFFTIMLMMAALILVGCDGGDGGDNNDDNNNGVGNIDANFGNAGVLLVEAQGQEIVEPEQDAQNIAAQNRNEQQRRELLFANRINDLQRRPNDRFRAAGDDILEAVDFNAAQNKIAYAGITDTVITKVMIAVTDVNGVLDVTFGGDGRVAIDADAANIGDIVVNGVVMQDDGKVTVVGTRTQAGNQDVLAVQVNADGTVDNTFGVNGVAAFANLEGGANQQDQGNSAVLSGGNIVIGRSGTFDGATFRAGILIIDNTGAVVSNFSSGADNSTCLNATVDGNGKLIGVGARAAGSQVFRLNADGTADATFDGVDGIIEVAGSDFVSVVTDAANNVIIAGRDQATTDTFLTRRLDVGGAIDAAFNGGADLVFEPKVGGDNQFGTDVFLRGTQIVVVGGGAAGGDVFGFVTILDAAGNIVSTFESEGILDDDVINEDFKEGFVEPASNRVVAVGQAVEDGQNTFDGVGIRVID